jgi:hypothetical protein
MSKLSNQEIFDRVVEGIFAQGGPSITRDPFGNIICLYRSENGRKCAAGLILPDEEYCLGDEGKPCCEIWWFDNVEDIEFLSKLQKIHDNAALASNESDVRFYEFWISEMNLLALHYSINTEKLSQLTPQ